MLATIFWDFPNHIPIAGFQLRFYSLMFIISFVLGQYGMQYVFKRENVNPKLMDSLVYWMIGATIIGARLGHVFFYDWGYYKNNLGEIFMVWKGGLASHGAAIAITGAMLYWSLKIAKKHPLWTLDRIVIVVALAAGFIRMGNWFNSEIYGAPANSAVETVFLEDARGTISRGFAGNLSEVTFTPTGASITTDSLLLPEIKAQLRFNQLSEAQIKNYTDNYLSQILSNQRADRKNLLYIDGNESTVYTDEQGMYAEITLLGVPRYPTQLFEAAGYWILFLILAFAYMRRSAGEKHGLLFGLYLIGTFGFRFFIEYYKEIQVSFEQEMSFNMGQLLSIPLVAVGLYFALTASSKTTTS